VKGRRSALRALPDGLDQRLICGGPVGDEKNT
jgi:hypothetical protein